MTLISRLVIGFCPALSHHIMWSQFTDDMNNDGRKERQDYQRQNPWMLTKDSRLKDTDKDQGLEFKDWNKDFRLGQHLSCNKHKLFKRTGVVRILCINAILLL